jgi:hypothetical protein
VYCVFFIGELVTGKGVIFWEIAHNNNNK